MLASILLANLGTALLVTAHTIIVYPGWRANNLISNSTFPYGMQWMYPCGGVPLSSNRTFWPINGGAISFQPGWFQGHHSAFLYINMGIGDSGPDGGPFNMSFPMVPPFQIVGPSNNPYPGTVCLPQVFPPANLTLKAGDNATIQVVELAQHGAALFSCVDVTLVDGADERVPQVTEENCFNSSSLMFGMISTTLEADNGGQLTSGAARGWKMSMVGWVPTVVMGGIGLIFGLW